MAKDRLKELQERTQVVLPMEGTAEQEPLIGNILGSIEEEEEDIETFKDRVRNSFFEEVDVINYEIQKFADVVRHLQSLRKKDLNNENDHLRERNDLEQVAKASMKVIKKKLYGLTIYCNKIPCPPGEHQLRKSQMFSLKKRFLSKLEAYQKMEHIYQSDLEEQIRYSYKTMNPEASNEEVEIVVKKGPIQVETTKDNKEYQEYLARVNQRHQELNKIQSSILELHQLYLDMQNIIILQDQVLDRIEDNINTASSNIHSANEHLSEAIDSSKRTRKMKIWIAAIVVVVIIIVIISVVSVFKFR
ncbi:t-SNARE [Neoconidiobolus thromboides FSU 785]|nr:t-SNARE [Neoconidiobolus thromboides FSU 785]